MLVALGVGHTVVVGRTRRSREVFVGFVVVVVVVGCPSVKEWTFFQIAFD